MDKMDKKEKKLDYEKPKLEEMSKDRSSGQQLCENGSTATGDCGTGTAAAQTCTALGEAANSGGSTGDGDGGMTH